MPPGTVLFFVFGLLLLTAGADLLVRGAGGLARRAGVTPVVVGLTVVAMGTSAPELAVSVDAALSGTADISLGNIVGSNVFNVLGILGLSALVTPLIVSARLVRFDVPVMIGASLLLVLLALDGRVGRLDGGLLFVLGISYLGFLLSRRKRPSAPDGPGSAGGEQEEGATDRPRPGAVGVVIDSGLVVAGLGLLVVGSHWLVESAVTFARTVGMSEIAVGLTVVAAGTSLPELATSLVATIRGERELAVGNLVGSNVSNLFLVLGPTALLSSGGVRVPLQTLTFDLPIMTAAAVACLPIFFTGYRISRWEGAVFVGYYSVYTAFLLLEAEVGDARLLEPAMLYFVLPLTGLTLIVLAVRQLRRPGRGS